jgi:hypothetical protein
MNERTRRLWSYLKDVINFDDDLSNSLDLGYFSIAKIIVERFPNVPWQRAP